MILEKETFEALGRSFEDAKKRDKIWFKCDYCGEMFQRMKHNAERSWRIDPSDACSDVECVQKKRVESNKAIFGTENAFQNDEVKKKIADKNLATFGVVNAFQNKEVRAKQRKTCQQRYGVSNVFANDDVKKKIRETIQLKYGVENAFQHPVFRKKQQATLLEKYGVAHALQNPEFRRKAIETCVANFGKFPATNYGKTQKDLQEWLNSLGGSFTSSRSLIPGREIDLYDPDRKLAIEYCGLHWHHEFSPEPRDRQYHASKFKACLDQGIQLLTIFSDEWETRRKQCEAHIKAVMGVNDRKIHGRKCTIKEITKEEGRSFFEEFHIQGKNGLGIVFFGLYHENELVGVMSLGHHNRQGSDSIVLDRMCFKDGVQVVGGASKLFARCVDWAKQNGYNEIVSFSDNRWSVGKVYEALGFQLDHDGGPDYSYVDIKRPNARMSKQSQKKDNTGCPKELTEHEWSQMQGLARIWDCGKKRWKYGIEQCF